MRKNSLILCLLLVMAAVSVEGQIVFNQPPSGSPQFVYSHWATDSSGFESSADQSYFPVKVFVPIRDNLEARIFLASSSNSVEILGAESSVSGLGDARIQVNQSLSDDHILISGGVNLPTGKTKLNSNEWLVVPTLSLDFLEFPARRLGEGFGFNVLVGGATTWGQARVGAGIAYRFLGEYEPFEGAGDYDSGDIFSVNAGINLPKGAMSWAVSAAYSIYGTDKSDGQETFKQSPQLILSGSGTYTSGKHSVTGWTSYAIRGENTLHNYDSTAVNVSDGKLYGNELSFGASAEYEFADAWWFMPSVKVRLIAENDNDLPQDWAHLVRGSADIFSFGGRVSRQFSEQLGASAGFRYFTGSVNGGLVDLTGYQISTGLMINF